MSNYVPMGSLMLGYVKDYRNTHGSSLLEAKRAVEAGWRPGQDPPPADARDAEIAALRAELKAARAQAESLAHLIRMVTIEEMGGTPDLFAPHEGWGVWDECAGAALASYDAQRGT